MVKDNLTRNKNLPIFLFARIFWAGAVVAAVLSCVPFKTAPVSTGTAIQSKLPAEKTGPSKPPLTALTLKAAYQADDLEDLPKIFSDDLDKASLIQAVENQLAAMADAGPDPVRLGKLVITRDRLKETLTEFLGLLKKDLPPEEWSRQIRDRFVFYEAGDGTGNAVAFTGYYAPVLKASRFQTEEYAYPLYSMPENLLKIARVGRKDPSDTDKEYRAVYRARNLTREEIDAHQALANQNLEIAWVRDAIEGFFLHVQGSGILEYVNGTRESVQYVGSNGYPYAGIGRLMIEDGLLKKGETSMQGIKKYLKNHPDDIPKYFFRNKRYIFFKLTDDLPRGSGGGVLVPNRSIATDKSWYPAGGLAFVVGQKPVLDDADEIAGWKKFSRFVVDQDTGAAIQGPARADLYFGTGDRAGAAAGYYMARNKMFYLVKK
ncbi:MAG: MltA domain-containing protein [Nitrospinae bacterium]|nr:MltA domain-containing protein [Nitrospinota bacterium]